MHLPTTATLSTVTDIMRELSRLTDPDDAAELYGNGIRQFNLAPNDRYVALSRRDLPSPQFRVTRNSSWKEHPNPWKERSKLPVLSGGLFAEILYSNEALVIPNLQSRLASDDPARPYLEDMNLLIALPHFDNGQSINAGILLSKSAEGYPLENVPMMLWMANLWGRATLNLVNRQKLDSAYQAIDRELKVVGEIQKSLLPHSLPQIPGVDIAAHYQTSQRAGGDSYDFFPLPNGQWGIFVADVSGHGTPAAVMMAITHAIAHSRPGHAMPPEDVLCYLNKQLSKLYTVGTGTFITAFYGVLDPINRKLSFSSAGHPWPRLIRGCTPVKTEGDPSLPLGIMPHEIYPVQELALQSGDRLILYTDGITEAMNLQGDLFDTPNLDQASCATAFSAESLIQSILGKVEAHTHGAPLTDDRTLLALIFN